MKALVTYYSETGNTEKLAQAIYDGAGKVEKKIVPVGEARDLEVYNLIFCGFPVQAHGVPAKVESFLKTIPRGKKLSRLRKLSPPRRFGALLCIRYRMATASAISAFLTGTGRTASATYSTNPSMERITGGMKLPFPLLASSFRRK